MRGVAMTVPRSPVDIKFVDTAPASYGCDSTGTVTLLNGVATGTDFTNRIGRRIRNLSLELVGFLYPESQTTTQMDLCRVLIVLDKQPNGAIPAITDVLTSSTSLAGRNLNNAKRFTILKDDMMECGSFSTTATQAVASAPTTQRLVYHLPLGMETEYLNTTSAITSISTNSIVLLTVGNATSGSGHNLVAYVRILFDG